MTIMILLPYAIRYTPATKYDTTATTCYPPATTATLLLHNRYAPATILLRSFYTTVRLGRTVLIKVISKELKYTYNLNLFHLESCQQPRYPTLNVNYFKCQTNSVSPFLLLVGQLNLVCMLN